MGGQTGAAQGAGTSGACLTQMGPSCRVHLRSISSRSLGNCTETAIGKAPRALERSIPAQD